MASERSSICHFPLVTLLPEPSPLPPLLLSSTKSPWCQKGWDRCCKEK